MTPEVFASWYERYAAKVFSVCQRLLGDPDRAAEIAQDVWLQAWEQRARYRDQGAPLAYLCTLARSRSIDELRRRRYSVIVGIAPTVPHRGAAQDFALAELRTVLAPALAELPTEAQRTALVLAVRGLSYGEAAAAMGLDSINAYRALLYRARVSLCERMGEAAGGR